ncbi:tautomerase family protein [Tunturiibacter lichenicola]|jgi:phenylpyruvate tautomerase PptA (4-oxalocrotonate tautomerase family)|uniref:tautomerase family protein n=1 Tax=Tunturiibacter lichenicola TaxID=2051959 RepID=UPI0021B1AA5A|nr:tautomerase family protein [Edaphobacter lichenicola]
MPLWRIYAPANGYSASEKQKFALDITGIYDAFLPRFYVNVLFHEVEPESFLVGGEQRSNFVRISIEHIARTMVDHESKVKFLGHVNEVIAPYVEQRGYDWELNVQELPFDLWRVQGLVPPGAESVDEKRWKQENKASARTHS